MKRQLARLSVVGLVAMPLIVIGLAGLSVALWLVLEALRGAAFAWAMIGLIYLATGVLVAGIATLAGRNPPPPPPQAPEANLTSVIAAMSEGFIAGLTAGRDLRRRRRRE